MLALTKIFFSSFVIALSGAMMPGPLLTANISESSCRGHVAGPLLIIGHSILELVLVIALLLGLAPFLKQEGFFIAISIAGGGILLWMAGGMFRTIPSLSLSLESEQSDQGNLIITGILMSIANPYWIIWWATIGLGYILYSRQFGLLGIFLFFIGHILADLVWYASISIAIGKGRKFLNDRLYKGLIGICAAFLLVFASVLIFSAVRKILV